MKRIYRSIRTFFGRIGCMFGNHKPIRITWAIDFDKFWQYSKSNGPKESPSTFSAKACGRCGMVYWEERE